MIDQILENTFNHLLASDYPGKQRLSVHQGKSIGFKIMPMRLEWVAMITSEGISVQTGNIEQADCSISGTPVALIRYLQTPQINPSTNHSLGVEVSGDLEFARKISSVFQGLDIDWEEIFSKLIGDAPAHQLGRLVANFRGNLKRSKDSAKAHLQYIVTERTDQLVSMQEAEQFYREVDKITVDAEKLEQQINQLTES